MLETPNLGEGKKPNGRKVPWLVDLIGEVDLLECYVMFHAVIVHR